MNIIGLKIALSGLITMVLAWLWANITDEVGSAADIWGYRILVSAALVALGGLLLAIWG